jgi:hypothetical protein
MQVGVLMFLQTAATCRQDFSHLLITVGKCSADLLERNALLEIIVSGICVRTMVVAQEVIYRIFNFIQRQLERGWDGTATKHSITQRLCHLT